MIQLFATLKNNMALVICVILATLLLTSVVSGKSKSKELDALEIVYNEQVVLNQRLSETNKKLMDEIKTKPKEFITITKEVGVELCNGKLKQEAINALPSKRKGEVTDVPRETNTADIDDRLPSDLIKLLQ